VLGASLLWRSTVAFTYLKVKSVKCLCLFPVVYIKSIVIILALHFITLKMLEVAEVTNFEDHRDATRYMT